MTTSLKNKTVFITGTSAGVGKACAEQFAANGANVILVARRFDRISKLAEQLMQQYDINALPLELDISNKQKVKAAIANLAQQWRQIDILVNNAGVGVTTELMQNANTDDWDTIIDINVKGLLYVTRAILPMMLKQNSGHIVNIGSTAAHAYYMGGNVYSASKHAVKAITRSLRIDLKGSKLRVSEIDPGMIKTEFSEVRWDKERAEKFYAGMVPLVASDVADTVIYCVTRPQHVNISEIMIYPNDQVAPTIVHREGDKVGGIFD
ncbi:MAG: SDR family NAD(P)-dependent oxidoreductase [Pseudomonadota bacterium]